MPKKIISSDTSYRDKFAISQSAIKDWKIMTPMKWYKTWVTRELSRPDPTATTIGSFLDCLLFTPDDIEKRFVVSQTTPPSEKVQLILSAVLTHFEQLNAHTALLDVKVPHKEPTLDDKDLVMSLCIEHEHYKNKPEQGYNDVVKKGAEYFEFLKSINGRKVISPADNIIAVELKKVLMENPVSKPFFIPKKDCEVFFQTYIYDNYDVDGFDNLEFLPIKGALDIIHVNHKLKQVREVDEKFTESPYPGFYDRIKQMDYPLQHSFYDRLLKKWTKQHYKGYSVMPPLNLVIDDTDKIPYLYMYDLDDLYIKEHGLEGTPIKGWKHSIEEIAWHFNSEDWSRPREHQLNGYFHVKTFRK